MSDNIIKSFSAIILAFVVFINSIGNFIGIGDIIPTQPEETTEIAEVLSWEKEEIVEYFNTAINSAKSKSKSITSNYMKHDVAGDITGLPASISLIGQSLIKDNMGEDEKMKNVTWTSASDKNAYFPVEGQTWASQLTVDDVKSATIHESNGKYIITVTTKDDSRSENHKHGVGHAPKAFNVVLPEIVMDNIPAAAMNVIAIGAVATSYPASTIKVIVDSETGNVLNANYLLYWTMYIPMNGEDIVLPFSTESDYTINW